jgi:hypothetical protein
VSIFQLPYLVPGHSDSLPSHFYWLKQAPEIRSAVGQLWPLSSPRASSFCFLDCVFVLLAFSCSLDTPGLPGPFELRLSFAPCLRMEVSLWWKAVAVCVFTKRSRLKPLLASQATFSALPIRIKREKFSGRPYSPSSTKSSTQIKQRESSGSKSSNYFGFSFGCCFEAPSGLMHVTPSPPQWIIGLENRLL